MPKPIQKNLRVPRDMAPLIDREAEKQGVSATTWMIAVLAAAVGYREPPSYLAPLYEWGSPGHVERVARSLGLFEASHLKHELRMSEAPTRRRIAALLADGIIEEVEPMRPGRSGAVYRWVGPEK